MKSPVCYKDLHRFSATSCSFFSYLFDPRQTRQQTEFTLQITNDNPLTISQ